MSENGMDTKECESLLLDRDRQLHPCNPEGIVADIVSCKTRAEIGQLLTSGDKIAPLIVEAAQQFPQLPPLQPPNVHHGLLTFPHSHPRPIDSFQGIQTPLHWSHSWPQSHPSCVRHEFQAPFLFPHLRPQFHSSGTFYGFHAPFPLPHPQPRFGFCGKSHEFHVPLPLNVQTGPLHFGLPQLHPSLSFHEIHAPFTPIGPTGAFQSPSPEFTGSRELMLEKEIRELLFLLQPPSLQVESLANMYMDRYGKPLRNEGLLIDGQQQGKARCSLTDVLMRLNTTRVIERQGHQYIVPVEDAPMYLAHGFKLGMPPASSNSNQILLFSCLERSKFTEEDVHSYFSQYGTVNDVRIPPQGRRKYGFVSFQDPGTAKQNLSERIPHFICGDPVLVEEYKKKHELEQEHPPKYLAHGSKLGVPPARRDSNQIYVVSVRESKFTEDDVQNYFSQYGTISNVLIPPQGKHMYGFVSFQDPGTAERILSERTPHFICGHQVCVKTYKDKDELEREQHHGFELVLPSAGNGSNQIFITFDPESSFTKNGAWKYFSHYGPVNDVRKKCMFGYVSFKMLAREVADFVLEPHEVSDVDVIHEHHTGKQLLSNHDFYGENLNKGRDQGIVTEKSSINVAPVMASPPTRNLSVHSVSEASPSQGDNTVESSHVLNHLDDASADLDRIGMSSAMSYKEKSKQTFYKSYYIEKPDNTNTENIQQDDGDTIRELLDVREPVSLAPTLP
ncbi:unnamed protein product [Miscanthus lutarioriparius]|uniref:RRM domain-containing protein n=1 Tax=Miscanthus lutarioriparius TaxID=422564 RepID=A0A811NIN8_9POAL|nr:unnamed protein product [Miscanthus lutarioriparius]